MWGEMLFIFPCYKLGPEFPDPCPALLHSAAAGRLCGKAAQSGAGQEERSGCELREPLPSEGLAAGWGRAGAGVGGRTVAKGEGAGKEPVPSWNALCRVPVERPEAAVVAAG